MNTYYKQLDVMKGIAIVLVVAGHIIQFSVLNAGDTNCVFQWIYMFHMNIFFFCSGFLYNTNQAGDFKSSTSLLKLKAIRLLLPYFFWNVIIMLLELNDISIDSFWHVLITNPLYGLWFLKSLFKYILVATIVNTILSHLPTIKHYNIIVGSIGLSLLMLYLGDLHFIWFAFGIVFKQYENIEILFRNKAISTLAILLLIMSLIYHVIPSIIVSLAAIISLYNINIDRLKLKSLSELIVYFGKKSMPIFILHFFIVMPLKIHLPLHPILLTICSIAISITISLICIFIYRLMDVGYGKALFWGEKYK